MIEAKFRVYVTFEYREQGRDELYNDYYKNCDELDGKLAFHCDEMSSGGPAHSPFCLGMFDSIREAEEAEKRIHDWITRYGGRVL